MLMLLLPNSCYAGNVSVMLGNVHRGERFFRGEVGREEMAVGGVGVV